MQFFIEKYLEQQFDNKDLNLSETLWAPSTLGVINQDFKNEKVQFLICHHIIISGDPGFVATFKDQYGAGQILWSINPQIISGMFVFNHIFVGSRIKLICSDPLVNFSIMFQKVYNFLDKK